MTTHYSFGSAGTARNRANQHTAATHTYADTGAVMSNKTALTDQERESLTTWGETFSAQIRPGGMALYMRPEAPRSTEDGQPYLIEWADIAKLRALLDAAEATR